MVCFTKQEGLNYMEDDSNGMKPCTICGKIYYLDELNCCSSECDEEVYRRFAAEGHTHGPDEPPFNEKGETDYDACPKCNERRKGVK